MPQDDHISGWFVRSKGRVLITAICCFVLVGLAKASLMMLVMHDPEMHKGILALDGLITGTACGVIVGVILTGWLRRRRRILHYVRQVDSLNHHVRNALQTIVLQAEMSAEERAVLEKIQLSVHRIDDTLRNVFPIVGDRKSDQGKTFHDLTD